MGQPKKRRLLKWFIVGAVILLIVGVAGVFGARQYVNNNLKAVSGEQKLIEVDIEKGMLLPQISTLLKDKQLIRNKRVFEGYVRSNGAAEDIKAGTYELSPSYSVEEIVSILTNGKIVSKLVTILPGSRIDQVKQSLLNAGFSQEQVTAALNPATYANHPALTDKPTRASLEGYLYPESFQRDSSTTAKDIVKASLDEMQKRLTPELREAFSRQGLSVHRAVILGSIVEKEVSKPDDRAQVAQVFLKRLSENIKLQSDATAKYGAVLDGVADTLNYEQTLHYGSPYNTYENANLTPGPISNVSESSLKAVANPAKSDWLFFVSGDDGVTYFSKTGAEHQALVEQHCKKLCGN